MTEAGWTRATDVNQPGWYWLRRVGAMTVVEVIAVPGYEPKYWIVEGVNLRWSLGNMDGEFLGPISPDSYQQGRVEELEEWQQIVAGTQDRQDLIYRLSDHLTQRTAERDTARRRVDELEAREVDVVLLRDDLEQRTAELEAANDKVQFLEKKNRNLLDSENLTLKVKADQAEHRYVRLASLQAELERVRGERDHAKKMEAVQKEVADNQTWHVQKLRTLILALPKVDGEIEIYTGKNTNQVVVTYKRGVIIGTLYGLDHAKPVAALYKHRQGMEG